MNEYEVTFTNGEVVVIAAWTPEAAQAVAEEDADLYGCMGLSAVSVTLVASAIASLKSNAKRPTNGRPVNRSFSAGITRHYLPEAR